MERSSSSNTGSGAAAMFRFLPEEVAEMEALVQQTNYAIPEGRILEGLANMFTASRHRAGKVPVLVQSKQVLCWFQKRRYSREGKACLSKQAPQTMVPVAANQHQQGGSIFRAQAPAPPAAHAGSSSGRNPVDDVPLEHFEAKSARDGAWYDFAAFLLQRGFETGDPEVKVRFSGLGEEDEWVNVRECLRQRSIPYEARQCDIVVPGDHILCFQERKNQAVYFDARVVNLHRRNHDLRGCRCRFLIRYDHDNSEEIVPLRKMCRRPETNYRLQILNAMTRFEKDSTDLRAPTKSG